MRPVPRESPQAHAERFERRGALPPGRDERFVGYGLVGQAFASGDVLGLRRWSVSSMGSGYTAVWHRDPLGRWTLYSDVPPETACARYIGPVLDAAHEVAIRLAWETPWRLTVAIPRVGLRWESRLRSSPITAGFGAVRPLVPSELLSRDAILRGMEWVARRALGLDRLRLSGSMPSGHAYRVIPRRLWEVASSWASLPGRDLGPPAPPPPSARLGSFLIPERGLFTLATVRFTPPSAG